jgi:DNA-binding IclR family transcriptional regulator
MWNSNKMPARQPHIEAVLRVLKAQKGRAMTVEAVIKSSGLSRTAVFGVIEVLVAQDIISVSGKQNSIKGEVSLNTGR